MGITIANANRSISLVNVIDYSIGSTIKHAVHMVPNKATPTIDEDTYTVSPTKYSITAEINKYEMLILSIIDTEKHLDHTLADNVRATKNVKLENIDIKAKVGRTGEESDAYIATLSLIGKDH